MQLKKLKEDRTRIDYLTSNVEVFPLFEVHCYEVLTAYRQRLDYLENKILGDLQEDVRSSLNQLVDDWKACRHRLTSAVENEKQMAELKKYLPALQREVITPQVSAPRPSEK